MSDLLLLSMLGLIALFVTCWIVILCIKNYEIAIFLVVLSPWISAIFVPNSFTGSDGQGASIGSYLRISLVMLIGVVGIIKYLQERSAHFEPVPDHLLLLGIYSFLALLSTTYSIDQRITFIRSASFIPIVGFLLGLNHWIKDRDQLNKIIDIVYFAVTLCLLINIIALPLFPERVWWYQDQSRFMGLWSQPNQMGGACMISYPVLFWKISNANSRTRWFIFFLILSTVILHILTGSRTTIIASALGTLIWLLVLKKPLKFVFVVGILAILVMLVMNFRPSNLARGGGFESIKTFTGRTDIWMAALTLAKERPLVGYGFGVGGKVFEDPRFYDPKLEFWSGTARSSLHNGYLSSVIGLGILGALFFYFLFVFPFLRCRKEIKGRYKAFVITVLFMCFLSNLFETVVGSPSDVDGVILWILWAMAGKVPFIKEL